MRIKTLSHIFALFGLLLIGACTTTNENNTPFEKNNVLIAQTVVPEEEEKVPTINEIIATDVGFTTLKQVIQSTEFNEILNGKRPYTVFAPSNGAFTKLPKGDFEKLMATENEAKRTAIMNCHIIPGLINEKDILKAINEGRGSVKLKTLGGTRLMASLKKGKIYLIDNNGNAGRLMITDIEANNGMIHTIETIMLPKK